MIVYRAKYEELHVDGQCWALVADTIPSSTSTVLLSATNDDEGKPYYYYGQSIIPGAFPYLKTISWKGAIADLPYYAMFRVIQEARIGRREASVWSGTEEGKSLRLDLCYNELWRDPEDILPNAVTPLGMPSSAHGNAPGLEGYFGAARDSSEAVEQLASQIQQAVIGSNNGSGTATPIGAGMIAPAPSTSSTHKLQKLREQQENHMAILERLADSEGVAAVQISFARHPHVFCRERDEDEVGVRRTWRDDMRSERHRRLVLSECERGIECRPSQRSKAQIHGTWAGRDCCKLGAEHRNLCSREAAAAQAGHPRPRIATESAGRPRRAGALLRLLLRQAALQLLDQQASSL